MDGPWHIDICPWQSCVDTSGLSRSQASDRMGGGYGQWGGAAPGGYAKWDVPLTAGTWTLTMISYQDGNRGIYTIKLNTTTIGTVDGYQLTSITNAASQITGIVVGSDATYRLGFHMDTKNASAINYYGTIQHITLKRTA